MLWTCCMPLQTAPVWTWSLVWTHCSEPVKTHGTARMQNCCWSTVNPGSMWCPGSWGMVGFGIFRFDRLDFYMIICYYLSWFLIIKSLALEPNSYEKKAGIRVDGYQLGQDFVHLHQILQESTIYNSTGLYGPDISQPRDHRKDLLTG